MITIWESTEFRNISLKYSSSFRLLRYGEFSYRIHNDRKRISVPEVNSAVSQFRNRILKTTRLTHCSWLHAISIPILFACTFGKSMHKNLFHSFTISLDRFHTHRLVRNECSLFHSGQSRPMWSAADSYYLDSLAKVSAPVPNGILSPPKVSQFLTFLPFNPICAPQTLKLSSAPIGNCSEHSNIIFHLLFHSCSIAMRSKKTAKDNHNNGSHERNDKSRSTCGENWKEMIIMRNSAHFFSRNLQIKPCDSSERRRDLSK